MSSGEGGGAPVAEETFLPGTEAFKIGITILLAFGVAFKPYPTIWEQISQAEKSSLTFNEIDLDTNYLSACQVLAYFAGVNGKELRRTVCRKIRSHLAIDPQPVEDCLCIREDRANTALISASQGATDYQVYFKKSYLDRDRNVRRAYNFLSHCSVEGAHGKIYSKSCAIVQASLSGKSRLMFEQAKMIPTIYVVNRSKGDTGYPRSTPSIIEMFETIPPHFQNDPDTYIYLRCVAFLGTAATFTGTAWEMSEERMDENGSREFLMNFLGLRENDGFFNLFFRQWEENTSEILAAKEDDINELCKMMMGPGEAGGRKQSGGIAEPSLKVAKVESSASTSAPAAASIETVAQETIQATQQYQSYWTLMEDTLGPFVRERFFNIKQDGQFKLKMVVCFDEARQFSVLPSKECKWDLLTQMNRAARMLKPGGVFVFMDTLSDINVLHPHRAFPSDRIRSVGDEQLVYTDLLTWDIGAKHEGSYARTIEETTEDKHMILYGRPIWYAMRKEANIKPWRDLILNKLACLRSGERMDLSNSCQAALIFMASLVHIDITAGFKNIVELIGSYLAHVDHYNTSVSHVMISYPSDPLVSSYVADYMHNNSKYTWNQFINILAGMTTSHMIEEGDRGELASMIIAIYASDRARRSGEASGGCVSVASFLKALMGQKDYESLEKNGYITKDNQKILEGVMNFNHFIRAKSYTPNRADLVEIIRQRQAILCQKGQRGVDLIIPVILPEAYGSSMKKTGVNCKQKRCSLAKTPSGNGSSPEYEVSASDMKMESSGVNRKKYKKCGEHSDAIRKMIEAEMTLNPRERLESVLSEAIERESKDISASISKQKAESNYKLKAEHVSYILIQSKCVMGSNVSKKDFIHFTPWGAEIEKEEKGGRPYAALAFVFDAIPRKRVGKLKVDISSEDLRPPPQALQFTLRNPHKDFYELGNDLLQLLYASPNPLKLAKPGVDQYSIACCAANSYGVELPAEEQIDRWYDNVKEEVSAVAKAVVEEKHEEKDYDYEEEEDEEAKEQEGKEKQKYGMEVD